MKWIPPTFCSSSFVLVGPALLRDESAASAVSTGTHAEKVEMLGQTIGPIIVLPGKVRVSEEAPIFVAPHGLTNRSYQTRWSIGSVLTVALLVQAGSVEELDELDDVASVDLTIFEHVDDAVVADAALRP